MSKFLVVVDCQKDFIDGALGTIEAQAIVPKVVEKVKSYTENNNFVVFTRDTHKENYLETQEGKNLPVLHCVENTDGWKINEEILNALGLINPPTNPVTAISSKYPIVFDKPTFGSIELGKAFKEIYTKRVTNCTEVELVGLCTGICVISNAIVIKSFCPELKVTVDASCCACVTPESHRNALSAMKMLQINVINE